MSFFCGFIAYQITPSFLKHFTPPLISPHLLAKWEDFMEGIRPVSEENTIHDIFLQLGFFWPFHVSEK